MNQQLQQDKPNRKADIKAEEVLRNRIYDKGFNHKTMPSVKRPEAINSVQKPLEATIYVHKNRNQPLAKSIQNTVLESSYVKKKRAQAEDVIQEEESQIQGVSKKTQQMFFNPSASNLSDVYNYIGSPNMMQSTSKQGFQRTRQFQTSSQSGLYKDIPNLNDLEMRNTKYLIDKASGVFDIDKRYLVKDVVAEKDVEDGGVELWSYKIIDSQDNNQIQNKRQVTHLDKYIDLILKNVVSVNEFIYLHQTNSDDPYHLEIVNYSKIKDATLKDYYTLSKKGLCHYIDGKPYEFIQLAFWLKERETYDHIKSFLFFKKFRKWKTLKMWRTNVIQHKTNIIKSQLEQKLFHLNPILGGALRRHRFINCEMESLRFFETSANQYETGSDVPTLEMFKSFQEKQRQKVNESIQAFSLKSRENIRSCFKSCLDALQKSHLNQGNDLFKKNDNQNFFRLKESAYEILGFPDNMSYEQRSELRKECSRFLRYSYLIDFLSLDSLKNIYTFSVRDLINEFDELVGNETAIIIKDKSQRQTLKANKDPLFYLQIDYIFTDLDDQCEEEDLAEFIPHPVGTSVLEKDFNILYHVHLRIPKEEQQAKEDQDDDENQEIVDELDANTIYKRKTIKNISKQWLSFKPSCEVFFQNIMKCITEGLKSIQSFERWSRHDEMTPYASVLEDWDDMVGDNWEAPTSNYLNPQDWMDQQPIEQYGHIIRGQLEQAFNMAEKFMESFNPFLLIYWEINKVDWNIFRSENLFGPSESLNYTLNILTYYSELYEKEMPFSADLGMLRVDSSKLKLEMMPFAQNILKKLDAFMPDVCRESSKLLKEWLYKSTTALKQNVLNIDDFVKQQIQLRQIEKDLPSMKTKQEVIGMQLLSMKEYKFLIKKEDDLQQTEIIQYMNALQLAIQNVIESFEKSLEGFSQKVKKMIPDQDRDVQNLNEKIQNQKFLQLETDEKIALDQLEEYDRICKEIETNAKKLNGYQDTLKMEVTRFENVENLRFDLSLRLSMWKGLKEWKAISQQWLGTLFNEIDTDAIKIQAENYTKIVNRCIKNLPQNPVAELLKTLVFEFKNTMPVVMALRNQNLREHHLQEIKQIINKPFEMDEKFTLKDLIALEVGEIQKEIQEVSTQATQEALLEAQFYEIKGIWDKIEFAVVPYKAEVMKDVYVLSEIDELFANLDEVLSNISNILGSRFLKVMREPAEKLKKECDYAQETIDDWLACQKAWIYLENIFSSPDIKRKLQQESQQFEQVDKYFKQRMQAANKQPLIIKVMNYQGIGQTFRKHKDTLNNVQKALENYLELKRVAFPRFQFLSNDELLEILAKAQDMGEVNKHIKKCFDNINKLDFGEDPKSVMVEGMISGEGELVKFRQNVSTKTEVELWLNTVQTQMMETLYRLMKIGKNDYDLKERKIWVLDHPGQIVATVAQLAWCAMTEDSINFLSENPNSIAEWFLQNTLQLSNLSEHIRSGLPSIKHKIIIALITQDVHSRDIIEQLQTEGITAVTDFPWQQQIRYYWDEKIDDVLIRQVNAALRYGYEYMGATSRLVITPLTDRCWMTITGALNIKLGAAPAGPAGTGKTESTKDLAKILGVLCIVYNCSDQVEYKLMQRLFTGLSQQGAWACLDEFNRIDIEVLSVVAQQLLCIRQALLRDDKRFYFMDGEITLNPSLGVFITMNPGYAGRTELPDNLKVLFRPVSMMVPNFMLIAEIMLFAEGFENAKPLSKKMAQLYKLSSEQLSQQKHYDFGMRAVKSVLVMAGTLKRSNPDLVEDVVLIRALRDSNVPKFLKDDLQLFAALIQDLFPGQVIPFVDYGELQVQLLKSFEELNYEVVPVLMTKILQLFETFSVRFGVMLVGFTCSAKSTAFRILQHAMTALRKNGSENKMFQKIHTYILNPKAISMGELYGEVNSFTQEWQDGLASQIMREASMDEAPDRKWVVFDGPVDAIWIENMNTVLDDNCMLCLANGQRIKLRYEMRMLFEVQDLQVASPATVSRCGMVFMTPEELGWKPYVNCWIDRFFGGNPAQDIPPILSQEMREHLKFLYNDPLNIDQFLQIMRSSMTEPIKTSDLQLVKSHCNLLEAFIKPKFGFKNDQAIEKQKRYINYAFLFAFVWSLGATAYEKHQDQIDSFVREQFGYILIPQSDNVYGFYFDPHEISFKPWSEKTPEFLFDQNVPYFNLVVQTMDTVRYSYITENLLDIGKQVQNYINERIIKMQIEMQFIEDSKILYVTGPSGTGKSVMVSNLLKLIKEPRGIDPVNIIFSAQTSSIVVQSSIENRLEKIKKTLYGARPNKKIAIFIDDINMPAVEEYGAQPPIELLRLFVDQGGLYDRKDRFWKDVENTMILACSAPPGGGRNELTQRFTRHFNMLCVPQPSYKTLFKIFDSIMNGYLQCGFNESVKKMSSMVTESTIEVYERILKEKKPIPSKFHYTFNLRDVSKVFQGMLMAKPFAIKEPDHLTKLWIHETSRVFHDRLINDEDRNWFYDVVCEMTGVKFKSKLEKDEIFIKNKIMFGDLLRLETTKDYEMIIDTKKLIKVLDDKQDDYNSDGSSRMNLVFFDEAIDHLLRISRVLRQLRGSAMLIGVGGSGKQSISKLSSYILDMQCKSIEIVKGYTIDNFREFIQGLMKETGIEGKQVTFLFTDTQIISEQFLEDLNNLLNSGEIPNIWDAEQKKSIIDDCRQINSDLGRIGEPDVIYATFVERVRNNLHLLLCMSPIGDALRVRCRKFPSLVDCCTLDWFSAWPEAALISVSTQILGDFQLPSDEIRMNICNLCKTIHRDTSKMADKFEMQLKRKVFNTPKSYLDFINLYMSALTDKRNEMDVSVKRLSTGLHKLEEANKQVAQLKIDLTELQPELEKSSIQVEAALQQVEKDSKVARAQEEVVSAEADIVGQQAAEIKEIADSAQAELDKVGPELDRALKAVEKIDKKLLIDIRTYPNPPKPVEIVMEGVVILFGKKYDWATAKGLMQDLNKFVDSLINYDKENINEGYLVKLRKHIANTPDFQPDIIAQKAPAAKDLCTWCLAMDTYAKVAKEVAPKKALVAKLTQELSGAQNALNTKLAALKIVKDNVAQLQRDTDITVQKKNDLENTMELTKARLERAEKLTYLLKDEGERWVVSVADLQVEVKNLTGDVFLSAACISYIGPFTGIYRNELISKWLQELKSLQIPASENYSLTKTLGDPVIIRDWMLNGLPSDQVSQDSAIYTVRGSRWPLLIDPQLQAVKWVKNSEASSGLKILKFKDKKFQMVMSNAIINGDPVLIEDVEEVLDPSIDPILSKSMYKSPDGRTLIRFAEKDIDYHPNFRLYITTKLPNPYYLPEVFIKVNIINFTVTFDGLEDQLLADVVKNEQPQIEQQRDENIIKMAGYKKQMTESEKRILKLLSDSNSDTLLDDVELISTLELSKVTSEEIKIKLVQSAELEKKIEETRNSYRDVSVRGSILFFVIKDLGIIDPMYQYSLQFIKNLFNVAMQQATASDNPQERLVFLIDSITKVIYLNVCRGLFEEHKLIYSFLISSSINKKAGLLQDNNWSVFLRGAGIYDKSEFKETPDINVINVLSWDLACYLDSQFEKFHGLTKNIAEKWTQWLKYAQSADPLVEKLPEPFEKSLDLFEKMMILKIFRPEKMMFAYAQYVLQYLGKFFLESPPINMGVIAADQDTKTPLIFVLTTGADPTNLVINYAKEMGQAEGMIAISMGQGQGRIAEQRIAEARLKGNWVLLQNCHLGRTWMPSLELILEDLAENQATVHESFRLFLTSMPATYFPVSILQNGIKLTIEPPRGLRANLKRSLNDLTDEYLERCSKRDTFHKLVLGTCMFHAIIQERRKFGPLGWNTRYEFNDSDLETSMLVLQMLLDEQEQIPWEALLFVTGHINYGGRVTDDWDRRCLLSILKNFYNTSILKSTYQFSKSELFYIPELGNVQQYKDYVENLPLRDSPEIFGMHENANINYQSQESQKMLETILSIQPRVAQAAGGKSSDEIIRELSEVLLQDIPELLLEKDGLEELFTPNEQGLIPSLSTVLRQEMERFNILLKKMSRSLSQLGDAIQGFVVMSQELDGMYYNLLNNQVPSAWVKIAYPSLKPLASWMRDLKERVKVLDKWLRNGNPVCFWMSGLYFPQGFLTGVLQTHARKHTIPIDFLGWKFRVLDFDSNNISSKPADGVYVNGLYLEGASWDRKKKSLVDQIPSELYCYMPVIYFIPTKDVKSDDTAYTCPVYKTNERKGVLSTTGQSTNFVIAVELPTIDESPDFFILRGAALLSQLND